MVSFAIHSEIREAGATLQSLIYAMGRVSFNIVCVKLIIYKIVYKIFPQPNSLSPKSKVLANSSPPPSITPPPST